MNIVRILVSLATVLWCTHAKSQTPPNPQPQTTRGTVNAALNYQTGNTDALSVSGRFDMDLVLGESMMADIVLHSIYAEQFGKVFDRINRAVVELDGQTPGIYPLGFINMESNRNRKIDLRFNGGAGAGYHFTAFDIDTKASGMLLWEYSDFASADAVSAPLISCRIRMQRNFPSGSTVRLVVLGQRYMTRNVFRVSNLLSIAAPIVGRLSLSLGLEHRYETIQVIGVTAHDLMTRFGIEFKF